MFRDMVNYTNIRTISQPNFCTKSSRNFAIFDEIDRILWRKSQQNKVFVFLQTPIILESAKKSDVNSCIFKILCVFQKYCL